MFKSTLSSLYLCQLCFATLVSWPSRSFFKKCLCSDMCSLTEGLTSVTTSRQTIKKPFSLNSTLSDCNFSQFTLKLTYNSLETSQNSIKRQRRETQQVFYIYTKNWHWEYIWNLFSHSIFLYFAQYRIVLYIIEN